MYFGVWLLVINNMDTRDLRLKYLLLYRGYKSGVVSDGLEKAKQVPREEALRKVEKKMTQRPVFVFQ